MKKCVVHIGMHKTGTSSIQRTLYNHLNHESIDYLDLGGANHSLPIAALFEANPKRKEILLKRFLSEREEEDREGSLNKLMAKMIDQFKNMKSGTLIISGEGIRAIDPKGLIQFRDLLATYFDEIKIIGYVREPVSYLESAFQQIAKEGQCLQRLDRIYPYYRKFGNFEEIFGEENLLLYKFDRDRLYQGDVVKDFCKRIGFSIPDEKIVRSNESISLNALSALCNFWSCEGGKYFLGLPKRKKKRFISFFRFVKGDKLHFSKELVQPILDRNRQDLEWIEQRLGEPLETDLSYKEPAVTDLEDLQHMQISEIDKIMRIFEKKRKRNRYLEKNTDVAKVIDEFLVCMERSKRSDNRREGM